MLVIKKKLMWFHFVSISKLQAVRCLKIIWPYEIIREEFVNIKLWKPHTRWKLNFVSIAKIIFLKLNGFIYIFVIFIFVTWLEGNKLELILLAYFTSSMLTAVWEDTRYICFWVY
jgi:hypothetical protein